MTVAPLTFDEIGYWSELKLEIVEKYGSAYTTAFKNSRLKKYYIDGFSGAGVHISKKTAAQVEGSPARALKVSPPFDGYYFIDLDEDKTSYLQQMCGKRSDVHIHTGDSSEYLTKTLLPQIRYEEYKARSLPARPLRASSGLGSYVPGRAIQNDRHVS
jgi:three-Cys-motif partner protein